MCERVPVGASQEQHEEGEYSECFLVFVEVHSLVWLHCLPPHRASLGSISH
jgi:hypothetical protein